MRDQRAWAIAGFVVLAALFVACTYVGATT
jgi:hypothetical protein